MNVPCQVAAAAAERNNTTTSTITANATLGPPTDIKIIAGVAPDLTPAIPEYI
jgi:hypothetical protein